MPINTASQTRKIGNFDNFDRKIQPYRAEKIIFSSVGVNTPIMSPPPQIAALIIITKTYHHERGCKVFLCIQLPFFLLRGMFPEK